MTRDEILARLRETDPARRRALGAEADRVRAATVGDAVHLRALLEISNHCVRRCAYCGIRAAQSGPERYRMTDGEILDGARRATALGFGTVVLQAGQDPGLDAERIAGMIRRIKKATPLAVTLSLGEREAGELALWREAGADRYLLRFETSDPALYRAIHPSLPGEVSDRIAQLGTLRSLGYETGSGVMVGIPGQSFSSLADDVALFGRMDLDMVGVGPYLPHPDTPLGRGEGPAPLPAGEQVPATEAMTLVVLALTRLVCPEANLPATTALSTLADDGGRESGLRWGANVVMPNLTPARYRRLYAIYPAKACLRREAEEDLAVLGEQLGRLGRHPATGPGSRRHGTGARPSSG